MLTYISKIKNPMNSSFFKFFGMNGKKANLSFYSLVGFFVYSIFFPAPSGYFQSIKAKIQLTSTDSIFDYTLPLFAAIVIFFVFFEDYKGKVHEMIAFYNTSTFNKIMLYRWSYFVSFFIIGLIICSFFYYRNNAFIDLTSILLSIRFIPNVLFLTSLILVVTVLTKNSFIGLFVTITYYAVDFLSSGVLLKIFSIGAHSHNYYYSHSPEYYYFNRSIILLLSIVFVYISVKKSSKV